MCRSKRWQHRIPAPDNIRQAFDGIDTITTQYNKGKPCVDNFPKRRDIRPYRSTHYLQDYAKQVWVNAAVGLQGLAFQQANMLSEYQKQHVTELPIRFELMTFRLQGERSGQLS